MAGIGVGARYGVHADNLTNVARGIVERVLYVVRGEGLARAPQPKEGVFGRLSSIRRRLLQVTTPTPVVAREDYPSLYLGRKRGLYQRALESLSLKAVHSRDATCSTFLKAEKVDFLSKDDPAPRVIQPRSPRYNLEVGRYLKLFEKRLFCSFESVFGYKVICKGLNASETATVMRANWDSYRRPVAIGLDASRFDQHVSSEALRWEHSVYNAVFDSPELRRLLKWQLHNKGVARTGKYRVDYETEGCRMSGDINTSLGNCLIMSSIVLCYCETYGIDARLSNNGDDCVVILDESQIERMAGIDAWFLEFGFTLTRDPAVRVFEEIQFCQCQPVLTSTGWRMVRNPFTAMSKDAVSLMSWDTDLAIRQWANAIGTCGLSLTSGVPVWEQWYRRLVVYGGGANGGSVEHIQETGMHYMSKGVKGGVVTQEARYSFYLAFGITPDLQLALEAEYREPLSVGPLTPMMLPQAHAYDTQNNSLAKWRKPRT